PAARFASAAWNSVALSSIDAPNNEERRDVLGLLGYRVVDRLRRRHVRHDRRSSGRGVHRNTAAIPRLSACSRPLESTSTVCRVWRMTSPAHRQPFATGRLFSWLPTWPGRQASRAPLPTPLPLQ